MIILALDTSTDQGAVALLRDGEAIAEATFSRIATRPHLFGAIGQVLRQAGRAAGEIDLFAVGNGPGSFTGIRVGIAAAKGLALPRSRPLKSASSIDALAWVARSRRPRDCQRLCILGDARRGEVWFAWYGPDGRRTSDCQIGTLEAIVDQLHEPAWFVSAEIERFAPALGALAGGFASVCPTPVYPSAVAVGRLALERFEADGRQGDRDIEPLYLRQPQYKQQLG